MDRIRGEKPDTEVCPALKTVYSSPSYVHFSLCSTGDTDAHYCRYELSDGIDTLWGRDEMGSGTDEDDADGGMEGELAVSPSPSEDDIERQIRNEFT